MRILVIYGNTERLETTRHLFEERAKTVFIADDLVNFEHDTNGYDIIFSLHCKRIFPKWLVKSAKCINIHPGYNPYNRGMFPHVFSIINGLPAGATIHVMDDQIDHGAIIAQQEVPVSIYDTSETLYKRVLDAEFNLLAVTLDRIISGAYATYQAKEEGNYNSLSDFKNLCELGDEHSKTITMLRALSHGNYKNAKLGDRYLKLEFI